MVQQQENVQQRFSTLLENDYDYERPRRGQLCRATILSVDENAVIVDLGCKRDGIVPRTDLERLEDAYLDDLRVGKSVPVCVLNVSGRQGDLVVSLDQGLAQQDWLLAEDLLESGEVCQAEVIHANRGGILVQFGRLRGFVPNSHLAATSQGARGERLHREKSGLLGQTLSLQVIEVDQQRRRLVLSQRFAKKHMRKKLLAELTEGEVRTGVVRNLAKFGAFVDLGGLDGLIHISELDWKHLNHPSEALSVGDEVEVYVLKVDRQQERVGLSRKRLLPDPWPRVTEGLQVGQVVEGKVTNVAGFGIFVDLGEGVEGLVHASEIPEGDANWTSLEPGSPLKVCVLSINRWQHRIALSLKDVPAIIPPMQVEALPALADAE